MKSCYHLSYFTLKNSNYQTPESKKLMPYVVAKLIVCILFLWILVGCTTDDKYEQNLNPDHVLLFYLAGDNNLSSEVYEKLEEIKKISVSTDKRLLIYTDTRTETPRLYELKAVKGTNELHLLREYAESNSADADVFGKVLEEVATSYPAASYGLVLFSHASGWMPEGSYSRPSLLSVIVDERSEMEITDLARAIPQNMFEYIIFEACHMAGIEVAYELRDKTKYLVASSAEIVSPGFTAIYGEWGFELLNNKPINFTDHAYTWFANQTNYMQSATFSVIETKNLEALAQFIKENCNWNQAINISNLQNFDRSSNQFFFDFKDYYAQLLSTDEQRQELKRLIHACIVWKAATPYFMLGYNGFKINQHSGLTSYVMQDRYPNLNENYYKMSWYIETRNLTRLLN